MRIAVISNTAWSIYNFRAGLIKGLQAEGHDVIAAAPEDDYCDRIKELCPFVPLNSIQPKGRNIFKELAVVKEMRQLYKREKLDAIISYTIKPNVYGGLARRGLPVKTISTINGLGYAFQSSGMLNKLVRLLYKMGLRSSSLVVFQNKDDRQELIDLGVIQAQNTRLTPGSGVDISKFYQRPSFTRAGQNMHFLLSARLVAEKGIREYVEAARIVKKQYPEVVYLLLGMPADNPSAITQQEIQDWTKDQVVNYVGKTDDMNSFMNDVDCLVLPSYYREGIPRVLLEGLSKGLPLISTDSIGCREVILPDQSNGKLIQPKSIESLAEAMLHMIESALEERQKMGEASRQYAISRFDEQLVVKQYFDFLEEVS